MASLKRFAILGTITAAVLALAAACAPGQQPAGKTSDQPAAAARKGEGPVLAKVGPTEFYASDLDQKVEEIPAYARKNFLTKEGKMKLLDNLVRSEVLYLAALDAGFEQRADVQAKIEDARRRILQSEYYREVIKGGGGEADEAQMRAYYEAHKSDYLTPERVKVAHIRVASEADARKLLEELRGGAEFAALARERSEDKSSAAEGGNLDWITREGFIRGIGRDPAFEELAFGSEVGQPAGPVQTPKGWHVLLVTEKEPAQPRPFDEVKAEIAQNLLVSDEDVAKEYEADQDSYKTRARVKARHIQLATEAEAAAVKSELAKGASFDDLARQRSQDKVTSGKGGDLGYIYREGYIKGLGKDPDFEAAIFRLAIGQVSDPVQTKKGWHIVEVSEKDEERVKPLDEVASQIRNKLLRQKKEHGEEDTFKDLEKKFAVTVFEDQITDSPEAETEGSESAPVPAETAP